MKPSPMNDREADTLVRTFKGARTSGQECPLHVTRRYFLGQCTGVSLGAVALSQLLQRAVAAEPARNATGGLADLPHFAPKARRVIFLTQSGGPSQIELFDDKPGLQKWAGIE